MLGDTSLLPKDIQNEIETLSKISFGKRRLNIALSYTSTNEIERAIISKASETKLHEGGKVGDFLDTATSLPLDVLVRTSGEHRLSDFMLWQVHFWRELNS